MRKQPNQLPTFDKPAPPPIYPKLRQLDRFHYHEISDRCHLINSMIDDFVLGHAACNGQMAAWAEDAQRQLCNVMSMAAAEEGKMDKLLRLLNHKQAKRRLRAFYGYASV